MIGDARIVIAGAGPVGMTLALELARHGVRSLLVERNLTTTRHPKMDLTNGRSMELYRRLGLSGAMRAVGVPSENPFDILWCTGPTGHLLHRFAYPSARDAAAQTDAVNDGSGTAEPGLRISQIILEPLLRSAIDASELVETRFGCRFDGCVPDEDGVNATIVDIASGRTEIVRSDYLVGCDGGGSRVRRAVGIDLSGTPDLGRVMMIHFRSAERALLNPWGIAWHLQTGVGTLIAQDDKDIWTVQLPLPPGTDETGLDPSDMLRQFVGRDFAFEILVANAWSPQLLIADEYSRGRVFLAGDAAHQYVPTGGYGMNTGVGDAVDLGWKLAACINGWAGDDLLRSYEEERRPIALRNRAASEAHFLVRIKIAALFEGAAADGPLGEVGPEGDRRRRSLGSEIATLGNAENESWGIEHGYHYASSVLTPSGSEPRPFRRDRCEPATFPGARLPHIALTDSTPLLDRLGPEFTLLLVGEASGGDFTDAAKRLGVPLVTVRIGDEAALRILGEQAILVRPDQHIAWSGQALAPTDHILAIVTGRGAN